MFEIWKTVVEIHVTRDNRMTIQLMRDQQDINWETICYILHQDYGYRKICMKLALVSVTDGAYFI